MAFKIKGSIIVAVVIAAAISGWMYTGSIVIGGQSTGDGAKPIAEREHDKSSDLFKVRYVRVKPEPWLESLVVRGKTQATAVVSVRAQVSGVLEERLVNRGDTVKKGQLVCKVDAGARAAQLAQAQAQFAKAKADFDANSKLVSKGIVTTNKLKTMKASLDAANAGIVLAKLDLERSSIRANASGIVQDPVAQVGDMLSVASTCVTLVQSDPMKFSGQVSERDIDKIKTGTIANVKLISGTNVTGKVRYISPSSDNATRTFLIEIDIPNGKGAIRDGVTARAEIKLPPTTAYRLSPSWVTLSDNGDIGVRTLTPQDKVTFVKIEIVAQTKTGFWVLGLEPDMRVISLGQEYVIEGEKVEPVADALQTAGVSQ